VLFFYPLAKFINGLMSPESASLIAERWAQENYYLRPRFTDVQFFVR
jgi:hypothetical protein